MIRRVRGLLLGLIVVAACYEPALRSGAPCSEHGACPERRLFVWAFGVTARIDWVFVAGTP